MSQLPTPLDEYPIHQAPLPMARVATSDRNFYDRCYFNALDGTGTVMAVAGAGVYPHLGVQDGFFLLRSGSTHHVARFSTALDERTLGHAVETPGGSIRVEVLEPLQRLRLVCEADGLAADLTWEGTGPAVLEQPHAMAGSLRPTLLAQRFAQAGTWSGSITLRGEQIVVDPATWHGTRDRSWGIRPSGDPEPAGREADVPLEGFWWLYCPMRFPGFTLVLIVQELPDGFRTLNDAIRVHDDGRVEQLGWPRLRIDYRSGTRVPTGAHVEMTAPDGSPIVLEVDTHTFVALHIGSGYGGDSDWSHGQWRGEGWSEVTSYDLDDPAVAGRIPWGVVDHAATARWHESGSTAEGRGLFEHASVGRHDPTGFSDWMAVAP